MLNRDQSETDYSASTHSLVSKGKVLPFAIEIDREKSNLYPDSNENQRFCYSVTGLGTEHDKYTDLEYMILGISDQIMQNDIDDISVTINGIDQDAGLGYGECVKLTTGKNSGYMPDYPGLRFDTRLDKCFGEMCVSFELKRPYPIGRNRVYLIGSDASVNELSTFGPVNHELKAEYGDAIQDVLASIPVQVTPHADTGEIKTSCYGEPTAAFHKDHDSGRCCITVIQPVCVEIPLEFGAEAFIGDLYVDCVKERGSDKKSDVDMPTVSEPLVSGLPKYKTFY